MAVMDNLDTASHSLDSTPAAALRHQAEGRLLPVEQPSSDPLSDEPAPATILDSKEHEARPLLGHRPRSQEAALDDAFPSIRKITPTGSPEMEQSLLMQSHPPASNQDQVNDLLHV